MNNCFVGETSLIDANNVIVAVRITEVAILIHIRYVATPNLPV